MLHKVKAMLQKVKAMLHKVKAMLHKVKAMWHKTKDKKDKTNKTPLPHWFIGSMGENQHFGPKGVKIPCPKRPKPFKNLGKTNISGKLEKHGMC